MRTAQDFLSLTSAIQMDLRAASAKMVELRAWVANLDLPTEEHPFDEERVMAFVRRMAGPAGYTDSSLADELALMGADAGFIDRALLVAAQVRRELDGANVAGRA